MKNNKTVAFSMFLLFMFLSASSYSQMTPFTWDTYKTKFEIPKSFKVDVNNSERFSAGNDDIWLDIYPRQNENLTYREMKNHLTDWAYASNVYGYGTVSETENLNGYWGVYLEGKKSGNDLPAFLALLVHPDYPANSIYIWINYKADALSTAEKILKSFTPTY